MLATVGLGVIVVLGLNVVAGALVRRSSGGARPSIRRRASRRSRPAGGRAGFVVLGAGHEFDPDVPPADRLSRSALERLVEGVRLYHEVPGTKLVVSGGLGPGGMTHADALALVARSWGVPEADLVVDGSGWDTEQEARNISPRLGKDPFLLVTSALHMPRALGLFRLQGAQPIAAPTDHLELGTGRVEISDFFPGPSAMGRSHAAIHEYVGLLWSRLRGSLDRGSAGPRRARGGRSGRGAVVGPGVPRIAAAELAADPGVVLAPEPGQIARDLHRAPVRGQQVDDQRDPPATDGRPLLHAEEVLEPRLDPRRLPALVVDGHLAAPGQAQARRRVGAQALPEGVGHQRREQLLDGQLAQLGEAGAPLASGLERGAPPPPRRAPVDRPRERPGAGSSRAASRRRSPRRAARSTPHRAPLRPAASWPRPTQARARAPPRGSPAP